MTFHQFSQHLAQIDSVSSRLEMTRLLAKLYSELEQGELIQASYLMQGSLVPSYKTLEFQLSVKMVLRALSEISKGQEIKPEQTDLFGNSIGSSPLEDVTFRYKKLGDIGSLAEEICQNEVSEDVGLLQTYDSLKDIAEVSGIGSQDTKLSKLVELLKKSSAVSAKYVVRIVVGRMRLGFSTMTLLDALSWTVTGGKEDSKLLEFAYQKRADVGFLASVYLPHARGKSSQQERVSILDHYHVEIGVPVVPALCQRLNTSQEIIEKLGPVIVEPKYDGLRIQIHVKKKGDRFVTSAFTRSLEDVSHMFPELLKIPKLIGNKECILDAEAIGYSKETGNLLAFQTTITRKRKHNISQALEAVPIRFYVFDILKFDDNDFLSKPLQERKDVLHSLFSDSDVLMVAPYIVTEDADELRLFHEDALAKGLEGAVIKKQDSLYVSGRKGWNWVKIKESEGTQGKLNDTLDVILMGYYFGRGKRAQFGLGALLVGVVDENQQVKTIAKIGTGMSEEQLTQLKTIADLHKSEQSPEMYDVPKGLIPDVWAEPSIVVEVAADELTQSPSHTAGVALRFPRLLKIRKDKTWEQATTIEELPNF